jgi:hypothetical protein
VSACGVAVDVRVGWFQLGLCIVVGLVNEPVDQFDHPLSHGASCLDAHPEVVDVGSPSELRVCVGKVVFPYLGCCRRGALCVVFPLWLYHGDVDGDQVT